MLKRLWLVVSGLWAAFWFLAASMSAGIFSMERDDVLFALGPFILGPVLVRIGRYICLGNTRERVFYWPRR